MNSRHISLPLKRFCILIPCATLLCAVPDKQQPGFTGIQLPSSELRLFVHIRHRFELLLALDDPRPVFVLIRRTPFAKSTGNALGLMPSSSEVSTRSR